MLTGNETLAAVAAATGHRHGRATAVGDVGLAGARRDATWAELVGQVRHVALGLAGDDPLGPGGPAGRGAPLALPAGLPAVERAVVLLAAAATGRVVSVPDPAGASDADPADLGALAAAGASVDATDPGRFEALVAAQDPGAALVRAGGLVHSQASLLLAARSLAQGAGLGPDDRLLVALAPGVSQLVAALVVPCLTATPAWTLDPAVELEVGLAAVAPTLVLVAEPSAPSGPGAEVGRGSDGRGPRRRRVWARLGRRAPASPCRLLRVVDGQGPAPVPAGLVDGALSLAAAGGLVSAFGPPGSLGRPLPGVSLAVDDDGRVLVRTPGAAADPPGAGSDGWVPTGLHGRLDGGALHADAPPPDAP